MPYKGIPVLLTTWTSCQLCGCAVAHLDQTLHDSVCPGLHPCRCREDDPPVLEEAS